MKKYKVVFSVNGRRTEQIVTANSNYDAKQLISAQYAGQRLVIYSAVLV